MSLDPIRSDFSLADMAYERVMTAILDGGLVAGDRLIMDRLAEQLGISRTPVRDALAWMERDGLIEAVRRGYVIPSLQKEEFGALYQAREAVEGFAARLVAGGAAEPRKAIADALERATEFDPDRASTSYQANRMIHRAIVEATGNEVLVRCFDTIWGTSLAVFVFAEFHRAEAEHVDVDEDHAALLAALEGGDVDIAEKAMILHIREGRVRTGN